MYAMRVCVLMLVILFAVLAGATDANAALGNGLALQEKYHALQAQLARNQFAEPLYLNSTETSSTIKGDIYAVVAYPFSQVHAALLNPANWCELLLLHLNTKYCRAELGPSLAKLDMRVGKKFDQPLKDTYRIDFSFRINADHDDYFDIRLNAEQGPLDTREYRIQLEAIPVEGGRSFLHLMYSYSYGFASRMAMSAYLASAGSDKVGFTLVAQQDEGKLRYIGGMRGTVERNTMRYYLAIDAYLSSLAMAPQQQREQRLQHWFSATERYPRQLHEIDRGTYLAMKYLEYARQTAGKTGDRP